MLSKHIQATSSLGKISKKEESPYTRGGAHPGISQWISWTCRTVGPDSMTEIRKVQSADFADLLELEERCFSFQSYPDFVLRQFLDAASQAFFVALCGSDLAGYVLGIAAKGSTQAWVLSMATSPDYRRRGIGILLMQRILDEFHEFGTTAITLHVAPSNKAAIAL